MIFYRKTIANILLFIEALLLILLTITFSLKITILNKNHMMKKLKKTDYYEKTYEEIKDTMKYITRKSGYNEYIIEDTFTIEDIKNDINKYVVSIYNNKELELNTEHLKENITNNLEEYIKTKNKVRTEEQKKEYIDKIISTYKNEITLSGQLDNLKLDRYIKMDNTLNVVFLIDLIIILIINKKIFNKREYSTVLFISGISLLLINILTRTINFKDIFIYNDAVSSVIKKSINSSLFIMVPFIIIYIIAGLSIRKIRK